MPLEAVSFYTMQDKCLELGIIKPDDLKTGKPQMVSCSLQKLYELILHLKSG